MTQTQPPRRLPWVGASTITPIVFLAIYVSVSIVASSPSAAGFSTHFYSAVMDALLVSVALLVGYAFRKRFEYPLKGIFLTCAESSFLVILAISLTMAISEASDNKVISNSTFLLFSAFASSVVEAAAVSALITAGAMVSGRTIARKVSSV